MLSIVFFGTDEFATYILSKLLSSKKKVVAVVTKPDRATKRGGELLPTPVKRFLEQNYPKIPLFQPEKASTSSFAQTLRSFSPDLFVVVSYGEIINDELLAIPKLLPINIHPSALPKYRGASPLRSAILSGENKIGIAIIEMVKAMDAGDILKMSTMEIFSDENHTDIEKRMFIEASNLLFACLDDFEKNRVSKTPQVGEVTFTKKFKKEDAWINWSKSIDDIINFIRAFGDSPGALAKISLHGKESIIKITKVTKHLLEKSLEPQTLAFSKKDGWLIGCKNGVVKISMLQPENKKLMNVQDFINGSQGHTPALILES